MVCVAGVLANTSSSVSSAMWSTVLSLAGESSEHHGETLAKQTESFEWFASVNILILI